MGFAVIFLVGAAIQTAAHHSIGQIYAGRVIAGLGNEGMSSIGFTFAYWLDYDVSLHNPRSTRQWRIPVAIQPIFGGFLLIGLFCLKESPRWLMKQGRYEEATKSLAYMRCADPNEHEIVQEIAKIRASLEEELTQTEGVMWKECLMPGNRYRFLTAFLIMFCQQFTGTNSIGYYAPQIMETIGVAKTNASLFATGVYGTVKVVATAIFLMVGIEQVGRRKSLLFGAIWMMTMMLIIGAVLHTHPPIDVNKVSSASIAMVVMIYLYVIGYSFSWGPIPWVYVSEIFPTRLRSYGVGMAAATQWAFDMCITYI